MMGSGRSLVLTQPGRYFIEVAGLAPDVICDPAELSSGEVRDVLPHVFLFIFLPSHIVSLLALLGPCGPPSFCLSLLMCLSLCGVEEKEGDRYFLGTGLTLACSP